MFKRGKYIDIYFKNLYKKKMASFLSSLANKMVVAKTKQVLFITGF